MRRKCRWRHYRGAGPAFFIVRGGIRRPGVAGSRQRDRDPRWRDTARLAAARMPWWGPVARQVILVLRRNRRARRQMALS